MPASLEDPHCEEEDAAAEQKQAIDAALGALVELPLNERLPINLAYFGGLTHKEVAEVLVARGHGQVAHSPGPAPYAEPGRRPVDGFWPIP